MDRTVSFLYLKQEDVIAAGGLNMAAIMEAVEKVHALKDLGEAKEPHPVVITQGDEERRLIAHVGWLGGDVNLGGLKWIPANPDNPTKRRVPRASAVLILADPETSCPMAIMDGTLISAMRTAATTGVAAKYLARPDSQIIGLLGAGVQNRAQLMALQLVLPKITDVRLFDIVPGRAEAWAAEEGRRLGLPIRVVDSARAVVEGADVIVPATTVRRADAYLEADWIKAGSFLSACSFADMKPEVIVRSDKVVTSMIEDLDSPSTPLGRLCKDGLLKREKCADLGAIVNGKRPGRENATEKTFYFPHGLGLWDLMAAKQIYDTAMAKGIGQMLELWHEPLWA